MEKAKVYFTDLRTSPTSNLLDKMERLVKKAGIAQLPLKDSFVAIKIHFGEPGNLAYITSVPTMRHAWPTCCAAMVPNRS